MNAYHEAIPFKLPARLKGQRWQRLIDTADPKAEKQRFTAGKRYDLKGRSIVILRTKSPQLKVAGNGALRGSRAVAGHEESEQAGTPAANLTPTP
jgi:glycogen operon protein